MVALVVIAAVMGFQYFSRKQSLQTQAVDAIKVQLVAEYTRYHLPELQRATTDAAIGEARIKEIVGQLRPDNIDIVSIKARGSDGDYVARVEIRVAGAEPPDGKPVRYFRMSHSSLTGWFVEHEASAVSYYLAF